MKKESIKTSKNVVKKVKNSNIINQLHRINGQLQAVERMIKQGNSEKDILMLIDAASNSLRSLRVAFIKEAIRDKLATELDEVLSLVDK